MAAAEKMSSQAIVDRLDELPTLPTIVYELSRVINDPMSSTSEIEKLMSNDQSLTTKVLRLANSAYYAIPGGVSSLQRAIAYIGYDAINQLVLSASVMNSLNAQSSAEFEPNQFWKHSIGVAMAAETTAKFVHYKTPSDLFTCGLIHDMGKVATYIIAPEIFLQSVAHAKEKNLTLIEAETELGNPRHTVVGRELAAKWRLPSLLQASIAHHHQKDPGLRGGLSQETGHVVDMVFLANLLVVALQFGNSGHPKAMGVPKEIVDRLHLNSEKLKELIGKVKQSLASAESFLKIIGS
jgi:putative nucleotidyltransferase with HDIG domain